MSVTREFADGDDQPVGGLGAGELIDVGVDLLAVAAEIDGLPDEGPLDARIGTEAPTL